MTPKLIISSNKILKTARSSYLFRGTVSRVGKPWKEQLPFKKGEYITLDQMENTTLVIATSYIFKNKYKLYLIAIKISFHL